MGKLIDNFLMEIGFKERPEIISPLTEGHKMTDGLMHQMRFDQEVQRLKQKSPTMADGSSAVKQVTYPGEFVPNTPTMKDGSLAVQPKKKKLTEEEYIANYKKERPDIYNSMGEERLRTIYRKNNTTTQEQAIAAAKEKRGGNVLGTSAQESSTPYQHNIQIPGSQGGTTTVPPNTAQVLMESFDDIGEATNAATVLHHPRSQTYMPDEIKRFGRESWNHGENASFQPVADSRQTDGSVDRGLMRINSNTFNGLMKRHPDWMEEIGATNWDQMKDPKMNAAVARLVLLDSNYDNGEMMKDPSYKRWFAAPLKLRNR